MIPLGLERPFHMSHLRPWKNADIYIQICNSSKITVTKQPYINNFMVGGDTTKWGIVLKGHSIRRADNLWLTVIIS